jgi:protein LTV1
MAKGRKGKWIDKKTATHFQLVYRPQNDPLIHDENAPQMVLNPTQPANSRKAGRNLSELASELGSDALSIRDNEGEAANYGIYFDDTEYDYMQHLRELGTGSGEAVFIEATPSGNAARKKNKQGSLEEALRQLDLKNQSEDLLDESILPNKNLPRLSYQAQQDVPDAIAGFQPDMDPRLREVLEALEDDAYVDDEGGEDIFAELAKDAQELTLDEFEELYDEFEEEEDAGYESDATVKASGEKKQADEKQHQQASDDKDAPGQSSKDAGSAPATAEDHQQPPPDATSGDWMEEFKKFQSDQKKSAAGAKKPARGGAPSEIQSSIWTTTTNGGRRKTRKGALTNPSAYSMTSSSLVRTEQMSILDARFEKLEAAYQADGDEVGSVSAVSNMSTVQGPTRHDFEGLLDEFLDEYSMRGKKRVVKGKWKNGVQDFDEMRKALGPPVLPAKYRS